MPNLPTGTVTFLFSDIEGSTTLLKQLGDGPFSELIAIHRRLMRETFDAHEGQEIDTQGDAFFYSFVRARQAVAAAVAVQRAHEEQVWPEGVTVRIRLGLHTGEPAVGDEGYTGLDVVRAARIAAVARGGQVLLSDTTRAIVAGTLPEGVSMHALGEQRLRDIDRPEPLHELVIPDLATSDPPATVTASPAAVTASPPAAQDLTALLADPLARVPPWLRDSIGRIGPVGDATGRLIEQRVLEQLDHALAAGDTEGSTGRRRPPRPPTPPGRRSVADELAKLQDLRDAGALTDEQYARAVDQALGSRE